MSCISFFIQPIFLPLLSTPHEFSTNSTHSSLFTFDFLLFFKLLSHRYHFGLLTYRNFLPSLVPLILPFLALLLLYRNWLSSIASLLVLTPQHNQLLLFVFLSAFFFIFSIPLCDSHHISSTWHWFQLLVSRQNITDYITVLFGAATFAPTATAIDAVNADDAEKRLWSRETFTHCSRWSFHLGQMSEMNRVHINWCKTEGWSVISHWTVIGRVAIENQRPAKLSQRFLRNCIR